VNYYSELVPESLGDLPRALESEGKSIVAVEALLSFLRIRVGPAEVSTYLITNNN